MTTRCCLHRLLEGIVVQPLLYRAIIRCGICRAKPLNDAAEGNVNDFCRGKPFRNLDIFVIPKDADVERGGLHLQMFKQPSLFVVGYVFLYGSFPVTG
jgi:hypothetical protein